MSLGVTVSTTAFDAVSLSSILRGTTTMEDSIIIFSHKDLPGSFYFRGYTGIDHFLASNEWENTISVQIFKEILLFPSQEVILDFYGV
jgi:hypothetical protein